MTDSIPLAAPIARTGGQATRLSRLWRLYFWPAVFVGPAVLGFLALKLVPVVASFVIGLTDWRVGTGANFVGLEHYRHMLFEDPLVWKSLWVTLQFTVLSVPVTMVVALAFALLINQKLPFVGVFRTVFYLPSIMPVVATSVLWLWIFNPDLGLLNGLLQSLGLPKSKWLYSEASVLPSLALMAVWGVGPMMLIFLAGLQGVPRDLYEAMDVDGGNTVHKFLHVTIPMLTPTILFNLVIGVIGALQAFIQASIMTEGGPNNSSLFLVFYIYRTGFQESNMGYASALSAGLFLITVAIGYLILRTSRHWVFYQGAAR